MSAKENCEESEYLEGAIDGNSRAQYLIGYCWDNNKNYTEAAAWYCKEAEQGAAEAQYNLWMGFA